MKIPLSLPLSKREKSAFTPAVTPSVTRRCIDVTRLPAQHGVVREEGLERRQATGARAGDDVDRDRSPRRELDRRPVRDARPEGRRRGVGGRGERAGSDDGEERDEDGRGGSQRPSTAAEGNPPLAPLPWRLQDPNPCRGGVVDPSVRADDRRSPPARQRSLGRPQDGPRAREHARRIDAASPRTRPPPARSRPLESRAPGRPACWRGSASDRRRARRRRHRLA